MDIVNALWVLVFLVVLRFVHRLLWTRRVPRYSRHPSSQSHPVNQTPGNRLRRSTQRISGKAYVTDGDGLRVNGLEVRIAGIDAPEHDQIAKQHGRWFNYGRTVKSALIQEIGGKLVTVQIEKYDKFGRAVGTVVCNGRDIGAKLVSQGMAISAYTDKYEQEQQEARKYRRGQWGFEESFDPRWWRNKAEK